MSAHGARRLHDSSRARDTQATGGIHRVDAVHFATTKSQASRSQRLKFILHRTYYSHQFPDETTSHVSVARGASTSSGRLHRRASRTSGIFCCNHRSCTTTLVRLLDRRNNVRPDSEEIPGGFPTKTGMKDLRNRSLDLPRRSRISLGVTVVGHLPHIVHSTRKVRRGFL